MIPLYKQPLALVEETTYKSKKKVTCNISKQVIAIGDAVYAFKIKNYNDYPWQYVLKNIANADANFIANLKHKKNRTYLLNDCIKIHVPYYLENELQPLILDCKKGKEFINHVLKYATKELFYYKEIKTEKALTNDKRYNALIIKLPDGIEIDNALETAKKKYLT